MSSHKEFKEEVKKILYNLQLRRQEVLNEIDKVLPQIRALKPSHTNQDSTTK